MNFGTSQKLLNFDISSFGGVDFSTHPHKVELTRSPDAVNIIANRKGFLEKRTGWRQIFNMGEKRRINGIFEYKTESGSVYNLIHIKESLYTFDWIDGNIVLGDKLMNNLEDKKSRGFTIGGSFYIIGAGYFIISEENGVLTYGRVNESLTVTDEATEYMTDAPVNPPAGNEYFGTYHPYNKKYLYKDVITESGTYLHYRSPGSASRKYKIYLDPEKEVKVVGVFYKITGEDEFIQYDDEYGDKDDSASIYTTGFDANGFYITIQEKYANAFDGKTNDTIEKFKIRLAFDNNIFSPTVVTGRIALGRTRVDGPLEDIYGDTPLADGFSGLENTGDVLDGANLAARRRSIRFLYDDTQYSYTDCDIVYLYLGNFNFKLISISVDGMILQHQGIRVTGGGTYVGNYYANEKKGYVCIRRKFDDVNELGVQNLINRTAYIDVDFIITDGSATSKLKISFDQIDKCSVYGMYGGSNDTRVFVSGNSDYKSRDYASGLYDGSYFSDLLYTNVGSGDSAIIGYHKIYSYQVIVKDSFGTEATQYLRSFRLTDDGAVLFPITQGNLTYGAANASSFKTFGGRSVYLSDSGFVSISGTNVENQQNTYPISANIDRKLLLENNISDAVCTVYDNKYYAFMPGGHAYVCDYKLSNEWFYYEDLPKITAALIRDNEMYLGTADGTVIRFSKNNELNAYYDNVSVSGSIEDASPVHAYWNTPMTAFGSYAKLKTISDTYITCMPYKRSTIELYYNSSDELNEEISSEHVDLFSYEDFDYERFSYDAIECAKPMRAAVKCKNVFLFGIKLASSVPEPMGFLAMSFKYKLSKYYK